MAGQKYTDDPAITALTGTEKMPITQSATDKTTTPNQIIDFGRPKRVVNIGSSATPTVDVSITDVAVIEPLGTNITQLNYSGTPNAYQELTVEFVSLGADYTLTLGTDWDGTWGVTLPAKAFNSKPCSLTFFWHTATNKWILKSKSIKP